MIPGSRGWDERLHRAAAEVAGDDVYALAQIGLARV